MKSLFIGNLSYNTTEESLATFLKSLVETGEDEAKSTVGKVRMPMGDINRDGLQNPNKGFAFADVEDDAEAQAIIDQLNGQELDGRPLRINEAQPRAERPAGGFNRGGDRGGYNRGGDRGGYDRGGNDRGGYSEARY